MNPGFFYAIGDIGFYVLVEIIVRASKQCGSSLRRPLVLSCINGLLLSSN